MTPPAASEVPASRGWLRQPFVWLPVLGGAIFYLVFIVRTGFPVGTETYFALFDDGMISMRYGRNLAEGHGLVWNPGEAPVEGYTNFLWTLWMAALHLMPVPESKLALLVMLSGALILIANVLVAGQIASKLASGSRTYVALALWFTALYYPLIFWTLRGMEVGLITLFVSLGILYALRLRESYGTRTLAALAATMALAILTRDDAIVPSLVIAAYAVVSARPEYRLRVGLALAGSVLITFALHTVWRIGYYGDALPNTYHLKVEGVTLTERLSRGFLQFVRTAVNHLAAALIFALGYLALRRRALPPGAVLLAAVFFGQAAYSIYVGADAWEWMQYANRYITPAMPALLILAALGVGAVVEAEPRVQRRAAKILAGAFALVSAMGVFGWWLVASMGVRLAAHPLLFKLAERVLPGKITTLVLAAFALVLLVLPRWRRVEDEPSQGARAAISGVRPVAALVLAALLFAAVNGEGIGLSTLRNACEVDDDAEMTRYGLALREVTQEAASIAVARAGSVSYFSRRRAIDLLGKSDRVVARSRPVREFYPGHNKQNLAYSLGQLRPDIVTEAVADVKVMEGFGYEQVAPTLFLRRDNPLIKPGVFERAIIEGRIPRQARRVPYCLGE